MMSSNTTISLPLPSTSTISSTISVEEFIKSFTFGTMDYIVFVLMLSASAGVGVYFGFFSKAKNTTDEYLMGGKRMKTIPIAISLVASQLSGIAIMTIPAENYSFGFCYIFIVLSMIAVAPILCYVISPVFYENKLSNCYEYLELRFNKRTRQIVTLSFVVHSMLMIPVYIFIPSLAFSQVTGINLHSINVVVCSICVFYTMLGGIKAVVWTDVIQAGVMLLSVVLVSVLGTIKLGGLGTVMDIADKGGRLDFSYSWDPRVRISVVSALINGTLMWTGHIGLNQSCVQRLVSLPTLKKSQKALFVAAIGFIIVMGLTSYTGIVMYARYSGCDPIKAGFVEKPDKLMPFFVQDVIGHLKGMPGIFISCVFSAALSTLSAVMNSLSGVVYFDYVKPYIKHTDAKANAIMKIMVVTMGIYCVLGGFIVQHFNSIFQLTLTISGISTGSIVGIYLLGMFVPRINGKVAIISLFISLLCMSWIIIGGQMRIKAGLFKYKPLPTSIDQCEAKNLHVIIKSLTTTAATSTNVWVTNDNVSERDFSFYETSFYWYKFFGAIIVWIVAIPLSYIWKHDDNDKQNPKLYSPLVRLFLKERIVDMEEMPLKYPKERINDNTSTTIVLTEKPNGIQQ